VSAPPSLDSRQDSPVLISSPDNEWAFLCTAVSGENSDGLRSLAARVRWKALFDLAERHGVQPSVYQALSRCEGVIPAPEMRILAQLYQTNLHRAMLLARALIHLVDHLASKGIDVLPYKGLALAESLYGDMALRQTGDIDLLIHAGELAKIQEAVRELGYVPHCSLSASQQRASLKSGYEYVFDSQAGQNLLEVQWAILPRFYAIDLSQEDLFRRAVSLRVAGHAMKTPSAEDLFLILSVHAAKHVWGRLIWLCDLARIMVLPQLDWAWIAEQARHLGIVRIVRVSLLLTSRLLHVDIPVAADLHLGADPTADSLASEIEAHISAAEEFNVESVAYFRLMMRLRENRRDRMRFLSRLILTPGPGEWAALRLPDALFPLYRLVRFWRLGGKAVGR
jgi:hypothetical protein